MKKTSLFQNKSFFLLCLFAFCLGMFSCSKDDETEDPIDPQPSLCTTLDVKYATDIVPIMEATCAIEGCHVDGSPVGDYTEYDEIKQRIDGGAFRTRVIEEKNMPPTNTAGPASLTDAELEKIECWLDAGAPFN